MISHLSRLRQERSGLSLEGGVATWGPVSLLPFHRPTSEIFGNDDGGVGEPGAAGHPHEVRTGVSARLRGAMAGQCGRRQTRSPRDGAAQAVLSKFGKTSYAPFLVLFLQSQVAIGNH